MTRTPSQISKNQLFPDFAYPKPSLFYRFFPSTLQTPSKLSKGFCRFKLSVIFLQHAFCLLKRRLVAREFTPNDFASPE